jgi:cadmium resistance protein CadD (predicted permease)
MNKEEQVGWVGMILGMFVTILPFVVTSFYGISFKPEMIIPSILGLIVFLIGASKALPEILYSVFGNQEQSNDRTSKLPININSKESRT